MLKPELCRKRQERLAHDTLLMLDAVVVGSVHHVYYLTGHWPFWLHQPCALLDSERQLTLCTANKPVECDAADEVVSYKANLGSTARQDQAYAAAFEIAQILKEQGVRRIGVDASAISSQLMLMLGRDVDYMPIDPVLINLRRQKDADELALMKKAIDCTSAMYDRAREIIRPGVPELEVFSELHKAAVATAGEPLIGHLGNDYACGVGGGPAHGGRCAKDGEIYVLDLGPCYRGYYADNCRSFAVNRKPTDLQLKAWETVTKAFAIVERMAKPGVKCRDIFKAVDEHFTAAAGRGLPHHLGHGVGLQPHEFPHLNLQWDDTLQEGEVFTAEPGLYGPELAGGIRVENNYLVTATGVQRIFDYPMEL